MLAPFAISTPIATYLLLFMWGGIIMGIYTIGLTLLGERFKGAELASANATYVMLYAVGLLCGPLIEGVALDVWNPHGLMVSLAVITAFYVLFLIFRRGSSSAART